MASGFQQDTNQLSPNFYRVSCAFSGGTGTYPTAAGNDNGAVNPTDYNGFTTLPSSAANAIRVARGNLRWQAIIDELTKHADVQLLDVTVTSAGNTDSNNQPTALAFTVKYERDAHVLQALNGVTDIGGNAIDTVAKAVKHLVVTGIQRGGTAGYTKKYRVYDPSTLSETIVPVTIVRPDTDADVYADVTVSLVDTVTLVNA
jgi:hypothetical protein